MPCYIEGSAPSQVSTQKRVAVTGPARKEHEAVRVYPIQQFLVLTIVGGTR